MVQCAGRGAPLDRAAAQTPMTETFGNWLKRRRRALDLTQGALADCAGCSIVTIRKFEADERRPSHQLAELLAGCLQIPAADRAHFISFARQPETAAAVAPPDLPRPSQPVPAPAAPPPVPYARPAAALPAPVAPPAQPLVAVPAPLTGLIGREADVAAVAALVREPGVRVVTLTGPGGTGKTRLALEVGRRLAGDATPFAAIVFVDLTPVDDAALVMPAIAGALDAKDAPGRTPAQAVAAQLGEQPALLILDNFEQVIDAADDLVDLLRSAAGLTLLVTSRTVLRLYGEYEYPVPVLPLPPPGVMSPVEALTAPAVALFVERSRAANPRFTLTPDNVAAVIQICARLDGLPLAIELAAARSRLLAPAALASQLASALDLAGQVRHVSERQRTLRGAIDWSYRLLSAGEQRLFSWLGVFQGSFNAAAAAAIAGNTPLPDEPATPPSTTWLEVIGSLADKSMIQTAGEADDEPRYRLLVVLREYALEQLERRGERDEAAARHLAWYCALVERIAPLLEQKEQAEWLRRLAADYDNMRAAMTLGIERTEHRVAALRLASALRGFWRFRGLFSEGRQWMAQLLADPPADAPLDVLAGAYSTAGMLARYQDRHDEALPLLHKSLDALHRLGAAADRRQMAITLRNIAAIYYWREELELVERYTQDILAIERELVNLPAVATMLNNLASVNKLLGRFDLTRAYGEEALALHRQVSGTGAIISSLNGLGLLEFHEGNIRESQQLFNEALGLARQMEDPYHQSMLLANLAEGKMVQGRLAEARADLDEALEMARTGGFNRLEMTAVFNLGLLRLLEGGGLAEAWPPMREALCFWRDAGIRVMVDVSLYPIALLLSRAGRDEAALHLVSYVDSRTRNPVRAPDFAMMLAEIRPAAEARLGAAFAAAEAAGRVLTTEEATALALREGDALLAGAPAAAPVASATPLLAGDFTFTRLLAVGGMGEVYLGQDARGEPVAIKRLRGEVTAQEPQQVRRFLREGEILAQLNHPNIVRMLAAREEPDGGYAILMEYVPGGTLRALLEREERLDAARAVDIALELADALARAHHLGIIHRDLKPENVLLAADGTPRLTDFGLAFHAAASRLTQPGSVLGTLAYLSPEACRGEEAGAAGDVWALGVILVEMLTGRHPFLRDNAAATLLAIMAGQLPPVDAAPPRLADLLRRMLAVVPQRRISGMRQVAAELERVRSEFSTAGHGLDE